MPSRYTYSDTITQVRSVLPEFDMISPVDVPLLNLISGGTLDKPGLNSLSETPRSQKYEWIEVADPLWATTLSALIADGVAVAMTVTDPSIFVEGHIVKLLTGELVVVGVTTGANPVPLAVRGYGGTTAAAQTNAGAVTIVGRTHKEGAVSPADMVQFPTMPYNYCQEIAASITASDIEQSIERYGPNDAVEFETANKMRQLMIGLDKQLYENIRVLNAAGVPGSMGGLPTFIPAANVVDAAAGALTTVMVGNLMQSIFESTGASNMPDTIIVPPFLKRKLSTLFATIVGTLGTATYTINRDMKDRSAGVVINQIETDFGVLDVVVDQWAPKNKLWMIRKDSLGIGPLRDLSLQREMLGKRGTSDEFMISGTYTFQMRNSRSHGLIDNLSPTT